MKSIYYTREQYLIKDKILRDYIVSNECQLQLDKIINCQYNSKVGHIYVYMNDHD